MTTEIINGWFVVVEESNGGWVWNIYDSYRTWNYSGTPEDCNLNRQFKDDAWGEARLRAEGRPSRFPEEGCTRCYCGAKYWDGTRCASCGEEWDGTDQT